MAKLVTCLVLTFAACVVSSAVGSANAAGQALCMSKACVGADLVELRGINWKSLWVSRMPDPRESSPQSLEELLKLRRPFCQPVGGHGDFLDDTGNVVRVSFASLAGRTDGPAFRITRVVLFLRGPLLKAQREDVNKQAVEKWSLMGLPWLHPAKGNISEPASANGDSGEYRTRGSVPLDVRVGFVKANEAPVGGAFVAMGKADAAAFLEGMAIGAEYADVKPEWFVHLSSDAHRAQPGCAAPTPKL